MGKRLFMAILFFLQGFLARGQIGVSHNQSLQINFHGGKIIKNYPVFPKSGLSSILEINWQQQTQKKWAAFYNYPTVGFSSVFGSFGNPNEIGYVLGIMPKMRFIARRQTGKTFHLSLGWGYAFWTKKYNPKYNPYNMAISTNITNMAFFSATTPVKFSKAIQMNIGLSTIHFSNGHYRIPNNGINILSFVVGMQLGKDTIFHKYKPETPFHSKWQYIIQAGAGLHDFGDGSKPIGGPLYPVYALTCGITKQVNYFGKFHMGIYLNYYTDFYDYMREKQLFPNKQIIYATTSSIYVGYEFILGKFSMVAQSGWYIWNPFYKYYKNILGENSFKAFLKKYISNKIGFQFYPFAQNNSLKGLFCGIYIRANFGQADFSEYAVGFVF